MDWAWVILFASPWLLLGLLGARRGPTFMTAAVLFVGWYLQRGRRPRLVTVLAGGLLLGCLMLFLVGNRSQIYLGSDFELDAFDTSVLGPAAKATPGNDFVYGAGTILNADRTGEYWWGRRYLVVFFLRPIPRFLWPSKYQAASAMLGVPDMEVNLGTGGAAFHSTLGWEGTRGCGARHRRRHVDRVPVRRLPRAPCSSAGGTGGSGAARSRAAASGRRSTASCSPCPCT